MANRAAKSGLSKEAHDKVNFCNSKTNSVFKGWKFRKRWKFFQVLSKYDKNQAEEALKWISETINEEFDTNGEMANLNAQLRDGTKLCK